jgi:hypothetical protein
VSLPSTRGILSDGVLPLSVRCLDRCRILVTGTIQPYGGHASPARLLGAFGALAPSRAGELSLRLAGGVRRRLLRELGGRSALRAHLRIVAAAPSGRRTILTKTYTLGR